MSPPLPAPHTKHLPHLLHSLPHSSASLSLSQLSSSSSGSATSTNTTGTTLWLSSQLVSVYLASLSISTESGIIELGAGIGYLSLYLSHLGYNVLSTDIEPVVSTVLRPNVDRNSTLHKGAIRIEELNWNDALPDYISKDQFSTIITTDTIYHPSLTVPLLETLIALSSLTSLEKRPPLIIVGLENRDPQLINHAMGKAKEMGFDFKKISAGRLQKCLDKTGWGWKGHDWEGGEIWKGRWRGT
ncbi:hypothetical protein P7C73_g5059, partial [Tremellales sp. Uapishka_1]